MPVLVALVGRMSSLNACVPCCLGVVESAGYVSCGPDVLIRCVEAWAGGLAWAERVWDEIIVGKG